MSAPKPWLTAALAAALLLPASALAQTPPPGEEEEPPPPRVVVAAMDSAFNPYHEFFHHGGDGPYAEEPPSAVGPDVLEEFGIGPDQIIDVTRTGDFDADIAADGAQWARVERGKPYWFEGTNVIGISFLQSNWLRPQGKSAHGVGVSSAVLEANPEAVVVLVERGGGEAEAWAHTFPAVDITTTSYGPIGSPPVPYHLGSSYTGVVRNGKLHFGAVDNTPALSPIDSTGGPWWSIGVAGFQEGTTNGRQLQSGSLPDFVGNWTQSLPYCTNCESGRQTVSGTSFASPRSAGVMSAILLEARRAAEHIGGIVTEDLERPLMVAGEEIRLTNWDLRRALEEAAAYIPAGVSNSPSHLPVPEQAPWTVTGWGAITTDPAHRVIPEALAHLGVAGEPTRHKSSEACSFMTAQIEARYVYWNYYAFLGESWLEEDDPYIRC